MSLLSIIVFILVFSILVIVHELGHFWAAVRAGVRVEEFGLGLPPRIWGKRYGKTLYSFNWIPFGGFVKLKGEGSDGGNDPDSLKNKSPLARFWVITGGVLMNVLFAYVLLVLGFWLGMAPLAIPVTQFVDNTDQINSTVVIMQVADASPAQTAGLKAGDKILEVDGKPIKLASELLPAIQTEENINLTIQRGESRQNLTVSPTTDSGTRRMGVALDELVTNVSYVWYKVPYYALVELGQFVKETAVGLGQLVTGFAQSGEILDSVTGPIGIAQVTAQAVNLGFLALLQLVILLSVNLAIINIVPFPALDGGRLLFLVLEVLNGGRKVKPAVENAIHSVGFLLLLALIFAVTYKDIVRLF